MAEDKFDVIVVGAGVAGSTAAYLLAKAGLEVVLVERGPYPGSKNLSGGVLYGRVLHEIIPNFWEQAPVERRITSNTLAFMTDEAALSVDFKTEAFNQPPYNAFTVLRAKFDRWLAEQAEGAGAILVPGIKVEGVIRDGEQVSGVRAGGEEMFANVVIAADGANSFLAQEAGLRGRIPPGQVALGVKELIGLPREVIEERFRLNGEEGTAYTMVGFITRGVHGGGFLYTNRESLSVGLVMMVDDLVKNRARPAEILEDFLAHPAVAGLVKGGRLLEYGAHLVPEGGLELMPRLSTGGMLLVGDAAGLGINTGFVVRGMDLAIGSARSAAETVMAAHARRDFGAAAMGEYRRRLDNSFVMADMRTYANAPQFFKNERLYGAYPELIAHLMRDIYRHEATPKEHLVPMARRSVRESRVSLVDLMRDVLKGARSL